MNPSFNGIEHSLAAAFEFRGTRSKVALGWSEKGSVAAEGSTAYLAERSRIRLAERQRASVCRGTRAEIAGFINTVAERRPLRMNVSRRAPRTSMSSKRMPRKAVVE